jgi:4'-phosphopantetheinyl transferase
MAELRPSVVRVCFVALDRGDDEVAELAASLSTPAAARAAGLAGTTHMRRYVIVHATLERLLTTGAGAGRMPPIGYGRWGKPSVAAEAPQVHFSVSYATSVGAVAVCVERPVGVDVADRRIARPFLRLARRYFAPAEAESLCAVSAARRAEEYYRLWTRKEAWGKAIGRGVFGCLRGSVPSVPEAGLVVDVAVPDGFAAAVAVLGAAPVRVEIDQAREHRSGGTVRRLAEPGEPVVVEGQVLREDALLQPLEVPCRF